MNGNQTVVDLVEAYHTTYPSYWSGCLVRGKHLKGHLYRVDLWNTETEMACETNHTVNYWKTVRGRIHVAEIPDRWEAVNIGFNRSLEECTCNGLM